MQVDDDNVFIITIFMAYFLLVRHGTIGIWKNESRSPADGQGNDNDLIRFVVSIQFDLIQGRYNVLLMNQRRNSKCSNNKIQKAGDFQR